MTSLPTNTFFKAARVAAPNDRRQDRHRPLSPAKEGRTAAKSIITTGMRRETDGKTAVAWRR